MAAFELIIYGRFWVIAKGEIGSKNTRGSSTTSARLPGVCVRLKLPQ
jgi:hypothetical protein